VEVVAGENVLVWLLRTLNHENVSRPDAVRLSLEVGSMKLLTAQRTARLSLKEVYLPIRTDCCIFFNFSISMTAVGRLSSEWRYGVVGVMTANDPRTVSYSFHKDINSSRTKLPLRNLSYV
jgi:hypothetical protein